MTVSTLYLLYLSNEPIRLVPDNRTIVVGGGFLEEQQVASNKHIHNLDLLRATHEEADTCLILHAIHCEPALLLYEQETQMF